MKRAILLTLAFVALASVSAYADVTVNSIFINWVRGDKVNIRPEVVNRSNATQPGPIVVSLYVRANDNENWRDLFTCPTISKMKGGQRVVLDYFQLIQDMDPTIATGHFQIRAVASLPNGQRSEVTT